MGAANQLAVLILASLSFLGVGLSPPSPDWGLAINEGKEVLTLAPWVCLAPAFGIVLLVVAMSTTWSPTGWGSYGDDRRGRPPRGRRAHRRGSRSHPQEVVSDVTLELPAGGSVGIAGESGCGKTALIQALFGYARTGLRATAGDVHLHGSDADRTLAVADGDAAFADVRGRVIALVPQAGRQLGAGSDHAGRAPARGGRRVPVSARRNGAARGAVLERLADISSRTRRGCS